jgi:hypothetical protein
MIGHLITQTILSISILRSSHTIKENKVMHMWYVVQHLNGLDDVWRWEGTWFIGNDVDVFIHWDKIQ